MDVQRTTLISAGRADDVATVIQQRYCHPIDTWLNTILHAIMVQVFPHVVAQAGRSPDTGIHGRNVLARVQHIVTGCADHT